MREKILAQLISKYPGVPKKFLGLWATKLASKVTEEAKIGEAIEALEAALPTTIPDLAVEWGKEGDSRVTDARKLWEKENPKKPASETDETEDEEEDSETEADSKKNKPPEKKSKGRMPPWAQALINEVKSLRTEKVQSTMKQKVDAALKVEKIPEKFYNKRALPEKEEDLEDWINEVKEDFSAFQLEYGTGKNGQEHEEEESGDGNGAPGTGKRKTGSNKSIVSDIQKYAASKKPAVTTKT